MRQTGHTGPYLTIHRCNCDCGCEAELTDEESHTGSTCDACSAKSHFCQTCELPMAADHECPERESE